MTVLVIRDMTCEADLLDLARFLLDAIAHGEAAELLDDDTTTLSRGPRIPSADEVEALVAMDDDLVCRLAHHREGCSCREDAAGTDPRQLALLDAARAQGPVAYVPCPQRGAHTALADCWLCWGDVARGVVAEADVLAPAA